MVELAGAPEKITARHLEIAARAGDAMALRALDPDGPVPGGVGVHTCT